MAKNEVRIIGGKWRGRKLKFPDAQGLRPSQDRARETLFNWITPWIADSRCLDLFAGSGALGFEALSRGARGADLIDESPAACGALTAAKQMLQAKDATVHRGDALAHLGKLARSTAKPQYEIVFIDPPFASTLAAPALAALVTHDLLAAEALVYLETPRQAANAWKEADWEVFRDKAFGDSRALLLMRTQPQPGSEAPGTP